MHMRSCLECELQSRLPLTLLRDHGLQQCTNHSFFRFQKRAEQRSKQKPHGCTFQPQLVVRAHIFPSVLIGLWPCGRVVSSSFPPTLTCSHVQTQQAHDTLEGQRKAKGVERAEELYRKGRERVMKDLQKDMVRGRVYATKGKGHMSNGRTDLCAPFLHDLLTTHLSTCTLPKLK